MERPDRLLPSGEALTTPHRRGKKILLSRETRGDNPLHQSSYESLGETFDERVAGEESPEARRLPFIVGGGHFGMYHDPAGAVDHDGAEKVQFPPRHEKRILLQAPVVKPPGPEFRRPVADYHFEGAPPFPGPVTPAGGDHRPEHHGFPTVFQVADGVDPTTIFVVSGKKEERVLDGANAELREETEPGRADAPDPQEGVCRRRRRPFSSPQWQS